MTRSKRPTIEDVAEKAGVSRATVDRVINGRGGVRSATVEKVREVLESYQYATSSLEAASRPKQRQIEAIISDGSNPYFTEILHSIQQECEMRPNVKLSRRGFDPYSPETLVENLRNLPEGTESVIIVGVDNPDAASEISRLTRAGTRVVTIVSDVSLSSENSHVGQNSFLAGATAARLMLNTIGDRTGTIAVLIGHLQFRHLLDRRAGFEQSIDLADRDLRILHVPPYGSDAARFATAFDTTVRTLPDLVGVYLCGGGQPEVFEAVRSLDPPVCFISHEVTDATRAGLRDGTLSAIVAHDMDEVARKSVDAALSDAPAAFTRCSIHIHVLENLPDPA